MDAIRQRAEALGYQVGRSWGLETYTRDGRKVEVDYSRAGAVLSVWVDNELLRKGGRRAAMEALEAVTA